jgi:hypothetical protein
VGGACAIVVGGLVTFSIQATCALVLVITVIALYQVDRRWGIAALFVLWLFVPFLRRTLALVTGTPENDPLSLAPFMATAVIAALELVRVQVPSRVRTILIMGAAGFAIGLPAGFFAGPRSAVYAIGAYLAAIAGAAIGFSDRPLVRDSTLRNGLLLAMPVVALYAMAQRYLPYTPWDQAWLDATDFDSIGTGVNRQVRVFGTLNSPGTLAPLLGLTVLCFLTVRRHRGWAIAGVSVTLIALSLTFVRAAWLALIAAVIAHMIASRGRSAKLIMGSAAVIAAATLALSPVSDAASGTVERFQSLGHLGADDSAESRKTGFTELFPTAATAPLGHGLGTAGEASKLTGDTDLRFTDNGYLSLIYQVGPLGFILVLTALGFVVVAAWNGARDEAPGREMRWLLFAMLIYLLVLLPSGDAFYGVSGVILWFIAGQVLAYDYRLRTRRPPRAVAPARAAV